MWSNLFPKINSHSLVFSSSCAIDVISSLNMNFCACWLLTSSWCTPFYWFYCPLSTIPEFRLAFFCVNIFLLCWLSASSSTHLLSWCCLLFHRKNFFLIFKRINTFAMTTHTNSVWKKKFSLSESIVGKLNVLLNQNIASIVNSQQTDNKRKNEKTKAIFVFGQKWNFIRFIGISLWFRCVLCVLCAFNLDF